MNQWPPDKWNAYIKRYREDKRKQLKKTREREFEAEVQRRIKEQDLSRDEAIDQIEADLQIDREM